MVKGPASGVAVLGVVAAALAVAGLVLEALVDAVLVGGGGVGRDDEGRQSSAGCAATRPRTSGATVRRDVLSLGVTLSSDPSSAVTRSFAMSPPPVRRQARRGWGRCVE